MQCRRVGLIESAESWSRMPTLARCWSPHMLAVAHGPEAIGSCYRTSNALLLQRLSDAADQDRLPPVSIQGLGVGKSYLVLAAVGLL